MSQDEMLMLYVEKRKEYEKKIQSDLEKIEDSVKDLAQIGDYFSVKSDDILSNLYPSLDRQYDDINKQRDNIENIDFLNSEINSKKELESIYYIFKDECDKYYNKSYCDFNLKDIKELVSK